MLDRRDFMVTCSAVGLSGTLFPGVLWAQAEAQGAKKITKEMIENAAIIAEVPIPDEYKEMMLDGLNKQAKGYEEIYKLHIPNSVAPAVLFDPVLPGTTFETARKPLRMSKSPSIPAPGNVDTLAFASVRELAELVRTKKVSSVGLTEMRTCTDKEGLFGGADGDVSTPTKEIRSNSEICCDTHGRTRAGASQESR